MSKWENIKIKREFYDKVMLEYDKVLDTQIPILSFNGNKMAYLNNYLLNNTNAKTKLLNFYNTSDSSHLKEFFDIEIPTEIKELSSTINNIENTFLLNQGNNKTALLNLYNNNNYKLLPPIQTLPTTTTIAPTTTTIAPTTTTQAPTTMAPTTTTANLSIKKNFYHSLKEVRNHINNYIFTTRVPTTTINNIVNFIFKRDENDSILLYSPSKWPNGEQRFITSIKFNFEDIDNKNRQDIYNWLINNNNFDTKYLIWGSADIIGSREINYGKLTNLNENIINYINGFELSIDGMGQNNKNVNCWNEDEENCFKGPIILFKNYKLPTPSKIKLKTYNKNPLNQAIGINDIKNYETYKNSIDGITINIEF